CFLGAHLLAFLVGVLFERARGGVSIGGALISQTVSASALLGLALVVRRFFPPPPTDHAGGTRRPIVGTYFLGVFYLMTSGIRIGFLLKLADVLWFEGKGGENPIEQMVGLTHMGGLGTTLLILDTVGLAPLGEELLFRGILLPRLMVQKGPVWAVG